MKGFPCSIFLLALFLKALSAEVPPPPPAPFFTFDLQVRPEIDNEEKLAIQESKKNGSAWLSALESKKFPITLPLILAVIAAMTWFFLKKPAPPKESEKDLQEERLKNNLRDALLKIETAHDGDNLAEKFIGLDRAFRNLCFFTYGAENRWPDVIQNYLTENEQSFDAIKFARALADKQIAASYISLIQNSLFDGDANNPAHSQR